MAIVALVQAAAPVEMIILFGSYARGDWVEDVPNRYFSDFDLMVIVESARLAEDDMLWSKVAAQARPIGGRVPVSLLVHDIKQFNHEVRTGQYFYSDVVNEGIVLFDSRRFMLAKPKAHTPAERLELGRRNFSYWFRSASEFWRGTGYYMARGLGPHAAFMLHQSAERYFHAVMLVFTGYKPKTHDIQELADQTAPLHPDLAGALPRTDPEDERLFSLLKRAYIEARYSQSYRITLDELTTLRAEVIDLAERARRACVEQLATMLGADAVGELPATPDVNEEPGTLPELPALADPKAIESWREVVTRLSYERGLQEGAVAGEKRGEERGKAEALAASIVDVLRRRGIELTDADAQRILQCEEQETLRLWWDRAWSVRAVEELWG